MCFLVTIFMTDKNEVEKPKIFASTALAIRAYEEDVIGINDEILVRIVRL